MYAVGVVQGDNLSSLFFVQGDCYAANREVYQRTREKIINGVQQAEGTDFSETNEIGRVNKVDPLGITYLRIRGMWGIENPRKVFERLNLVSREDRPLIAALMLRSKFDRQNRRYTNCES
jgi:hypothetical protein